MRRRTVNSVLTLTAFVGWAVALAWLNVNHPEMNGTAIGLAYWPVHLIVLAMIGLGSLIEHWQSPDQLLGHRQDYRRWRRGHWERRLMTVTVGREQEIWWRLAVCTAELRFAYQKGRVTCEDWDNPWTCPWCWKPRSPEPGNVPHHSHGGSMST